MFVACSYGGGRGIALATARPNDCGARAISPFRRVAPMTTAYKPGRSCHQDEIYYI